MENRELGITDRPRATDSSKRLLRQQRMDSLASSRGTNILVLNCHWLRLRWLGELLTNRVGCYRTLLSVHRPVDLDGGFRNDLLLSAPSTLTTSSRSVDGVPMLRTDWPLALRAHAHVFPGMPYRLVVIAEREGASQTNFTRSDFRASMCVAGGSLFCGHERSISYDKTPRQRVVSANSDTVPHTRMASAPEFVRLMSNE